jgi:L-ascorbate metabolism protein UlaG (beta-lactamase superfamily)
MRTLIIIFVYWLGCSLNLSYAQVAHNNLKIINIGNEGFLLESTNHKLLVDALYTYGYELFAVPPKEITCKIMDAKAPFDSISLLLLTHYHKDHCDPVLINEYLSRYKNIPFVTNKPSIVFIDGNCFGFIGKKKQFRVMTPELNQSITETIHNIPVKAFGLKHLSFYRDSIDLEENMFNTSFLFDMDGIRIFHSGDIEMDAFYGYLAGNKKWTDPVDVAFLYYNLLNSGEQDLAYIVKMLNPKYIVLMHLPPRMYDEWMLKIIPLKKKFPNIILFKDPMDSTTICLN